MRHTPIKPEQPSKVFFREPRGTPIAERLENRSFYTLTGCREWTGFRKSDGYGMMNVDGRPALVHRVAYELAHGPIPAGMEIDHLCKNTACFNVEHLEAVTPQENNRRSDSQSSRNAQKTHCPKGHEYVFPNLFFDGGQRKCRSCQRARGAARRAKFRADRDGTAGESSFAVYLEAAKEQIARTRANSDWLNGTRSRDDEIARALACMNRDADRAAQGGAGMSAVANGFATFALLLLLAFGIPAYVLIVMLGWL